MANKILMLLIFFLITKTFQVGDNILISKDFKGNESQLVINVTSVEDYSAFFEIYKMKADGVRQVNLNIAKLENFGYAIFQVHSYAYNMKLSKVMNLEKFTQYGRNLGIVTFENQTFYIENTNKFDVDYAIAVISYNSSSPVSGGCNLEGNITESPILTLTPLKDMIQVDTPSSAMSVKDDPKQKFCSNSINPSELQYKGYYYYLPKADFSKTSYFNGIKGFLIPTNISKMAFTAFRNGNKGPANRRVYMQFPGTGMLFNTIVRDSLSIPAAYVPAVTYFCDPFVWEEGCNLIFNDKVLKVLSQILIVVGVLKTVTFFAPFIYIAAFIDLTVNCFSIGAYYAYKFIQDYDVSKEVQIGLIIAGGLALALLLTILCYFCYNMLYILYPVTIIILFTWIFTFNALYIYEGAPIESNTLLYWLIFIFIFGCCALMMLPKFRILLLILNVFLGGYYMLVGVQFFIKSNLIYIPLKQLYQIRDIDYKYVNGYPPSTKTDIYAIIVIVGAILLCIILRQNKTCTIQRRRGLTEEEQPLLRGSTDLSDEVFESPKTKIYSFR